MVGDHAGDVGIGRAIGATTFLVLTGHGAEEQVKAGGDADHVAADLAADADIIAELHRTGGHGVTQDELRATARATSKPPPPRVRLVGRSAWTTSAPRPSS